MSNVNRTVSSLVGVLVGAGVTLGAGDGARVGVEVSMLRLYFWISVTSASKFVGRDPHGLACYIYIYIITERKI
jgi:hypothetical protein